MLFGPVAGALIGLIGHVLKDLIMYGSPWWSWVIVSALVGLFIGLSSNKIAIDGGEFGVKKSSSSILCKRRPSRRLVLDRADACYSYLC